MSSLSLAFAPYLESFVRGRCVALCGDSASSVPDSQSLLATELKQRGARRVHIYDRNAKTTVRASSGQSLVAPLEVAELERDGPFDVVLVPNAHALLSQSAFVASASRWLSKNGLLLVASPNQGPAEQGSVGYYELYDVLAAHFEHVSMVGQVPFTGVVFVDFGHEGEADVTVDTSLVPAHQKEASFFVGLASQQPFAIDNYSLIETIANASIEPSAIIPNETISPERELRTELETVREQLDDFSRQLTVLRQQKDELASHRGEAMTRITELSHQLAQATKEREEARLRAEQWQQELRLSQEANAGDVSGMESTLRERAREILRLRYEIERRGEMVQELLHGLEEPIVEERLVG